MSSTNRGGERSTDDFYSTPAWPVDALLARVGPLDRKRILEPSAGTGAIVRRLIARGAEPGDITAIELDPERALRLREIRGITVVQAPFERWPGHGYDLIVMNPPFSLAQAHIERAISVLAPGGLCCALERLAFGLTEKRAPFRARHSFDKLELARRPSFATGQIIGGSTAPQARLFSEPAPALPDPGETDSADYAWFCFGTWPAGACVPWPASACLPWDPSGARCGGRFLVLDEGP